MNLLLLAFLSVGIFAQQERDELCAATWETQVEKRIELPNDVNYFVRSSSAGELGFATSSGNRILDLESEKLTAVPGIYDPVPTPDGKLIVQPQLSTYNPVNHQMEPFTGSKPRELFKEVNFMVGTDGVYKKYWEINSQNESWTKVKITEDDLKKDQVRYAKSVMIFYNRRQNEKGEFPIVHSDDRVNGTYQSFGKLRESADKSVYRMLIADEDSGLATKDYSFEHSSGRMETSDGPPTPVCQKTGDYSLPMINRQGTELYAYDRLSKSSVILRISDCRVVDRFPGMVGKADFSPSGRKTAFHVDSLSDKDIFKTPDGNSDLGIFVYDRDKKTATPVPGRLNENNYYPVFVNEDQIAFVSATKDEKPKFFINVVKIKPSNFVTCGDCSPKTREGQFSAFIGLLYGETCKVGDKSFRSAIANYNRLTPYKCKTLLNRFTEQYIQQKRKEFSQQKASPDSLWDQSILSTLSHKKLGQLCSKGDERNQSSISSDGAQ